MGMPWNSRILYWSSNETLHRNYNSYIPETRGIRTTNTIEFFPEKVEMPSTSTTDRLARATEGLVDIIKQPHPATPFLQQGTVVNDAIKQLTKIFSPQYRAITENPATTPRVLGAFRVDPRTYFTQCNKMDRRWKIIIFTTHLFNARKASLTSRVPSFCSNISSK
jgi:hypothetical protein